MTAVPITPDTEWLPEGTRQHVRADGSIAPPGGQLDLGTVPAGVAITVRLRQRTMYTIQAESVGRRVTLRLLGEPGAQADIDAAFKRVELEGSLPTPLRLRGGQTNLYINSGGPIRITGPSDGPAEFTCEVRLKDEESSGVVCNLASDIELRHLTGNRNVKLTRPEAERDGIRKTAPLTREATVKLDGNLEVTEALDVASVRATGVVQAPSITARSTADAGGFRLGSASHHQTAQDAVVHEGCTLTSDGSIVVRGRVAGSDDSPVRMKAGDAQDVTVTGHAAHCTIEPASGQLGTVTLSGSNSVTVKGAREVVAEQAAAPHFEATDKVKVTGGCTAVRLLSAQAVEVSGECRGLGQVTGSRVVLGASGPPDEYELLNVTVRKTLHASAPAALSISAAPLASPKESGDDGEPGEPEAVLVGIGLRSLPGTWTPVREAGDDFRFPAAVGGRIPASSLSLVGDIAAYIAGDCILHQVDGARQVAVDGVATLAAEGPGPVVVQQVWTSDETRLTERTLRAEYVRVGGAKGGHIVCQDITSTGAFHSVVLTSDVADLRGDCHDTSLTIADTLVAAGLTEPRHIEVDGDATVQNVALASGAADIIFRRNVQLDGGCDGMVRWEPRSDGAVLGATGEVRHLRVGASQEAATIELAESGTVPLLELDGTVRLAAAAGPGGERTAPLNDVQLHGGAALTTAMPGFPASCTVTVPADAAAELIDEGGGLQVAVIPTGSGGLLHVDGMPSGTTHLRPAETDEGVNELPLLHLRRGRISVDGTWPRVHTGDGAPYDLGSALQHRPLLTLPASGFIDGLSGEFGLLTSRGRMIGNRPRRWDPRRRRRHDVAAALLDLRQFGAEGGELRGTMVDVDVTGLRFEELDRLKSLDVFSPLARPLRRLATGGELAGPQKHDAAQRLATIAKMTEGRSVSGATRSSAMWATARSHHRAAFPRPEWFFRWVHWLVGYSQRPLRPLAALGAVMLGVWIGLERWEVGACSGKEAAEISTYGPVDQLLRILTVPLRLFRLIGDDVDYVQIGCHPGWQLGTSVVVALLLIFFLVALRNYLRGPVDD